MIIGPRFVWMHFPKCGGTTIENALQKIYKDEPQVVFDDTKDADRVIWHQNVTDRLKLDETFSPTGRKVVCCIRRLPDWILSRVHFEASRKPHNVATRAMIEKGEFFEQNGSISSAEGYAKYYNADATVWIAVESAAEGLAKVLDLPIQTMSEALKTKLNETPIPSYLKNPLLWFTQAQIDRLYDACPTWCEIEREVYGYTLQSVRHQRSFAYRLRRQIFMRTNGAITQINR